MGICRYPKCFNRSAKTWDLLDLCEIHHELIRIESRDYAISVSQEPVRIQRKHYFKIHKLIIANKKEMEARKK